MLRQSVSQFHRSSVSLEWRDFDFCVKIYNVLGSDAWITRLKKVCHVSPKPARRTSQIPMVSALFSLTRPSACRCVVIFVDSYAWPGPLECNKQLCESLVAYRTCLLHMLFFAPSTFFLRNHAYFRNTAAPTLRTRAQRTYACLYHLSREDYLVSSDDHSTHFLMTTFLMPPAPRVLRTSIFTVLLSQHKRR